MNRRKEKETVLIRLLTLFTFLFHVIFMDWFCSHDILFRFLQISLKTYIIVFVAYLKIKFFPH